MGLCLGYGSALRYWLTKRGDEALPEAATAGAFRQAEATSALVKEGALPFAPERGRPLHLVVCNQALKHVVKDAQVHACQVELPNGSFYRLAGGNIVSSPELTFLQMAASSNLWELIEIGNYLCSTFSIGDEGRGYTGSRGQLMSLEQLDLFLSALPPYARGVRKARRAASEVVELTASPMESQLALHYSLAPDQGGRGPFVISANQVIQIDEHAQRLLSSGYLVGDLFLPEYKSDLEFDSEEFHTGKYRLDHTQARRNVLEAMQIKTISATYGQMDTMSNFDDFTWLLEKRLGIEHPQYTYRQRCKQQDLYAWLTDHKRRLF